MSRLTAFSVLFAAFPFVASAQQAPAPTGAEAPATPGWAALPRMQLEAIFAAPLKDTVIQRLRDPVDGTICYVYSPIEVQHSPETGSGFVNYGTMSIGSISCTASSVFAIPSAPPAGGSR